MLSNAVKFSTKGNIIIKAILVDTDLIKIIIKDEGIGIDDREKMLLFDKLEKKVKNNK